MKILKKINWPRFILLLVFICGFTFFSLLAAWGRDEGTLGNSWFLNFMADLFSVFRFPTHVLFWNYMNGNIFLAGLFINSIFYAFVIEGLISIIKRFKKISAAKNHAL